MNSFVFVRSRSRRSISSDKGETAAVGVSRIKLPPNSKAEPAAANEESAVWAWLPGFGEKRTARQMPNPIRRAALEAGIQRGHGENSWVAGACTAARTAPMMEV